MATSRAWRRVADSVREGVVWAPSIWWMKLTHGSRERERDHVAARDGHGARTGVSTTIWWKSRRRTEGRQIFPSSSLEPDRTVAQLPNTLGALKRSSFGSPERQHRSVKDEIRANLLSRLSAGGPLFEGVLGYDETVMPQIVNALLSRHNFILLGLRGQAKSRILRALTTLLDETMPIVAGSEINDSPFRPISKFARDADRGGRRRHARRVGEPRPAIRRETRHARRHRRRPHRRPRPDQGRARRAHSLRRAHDPLRHAAAGEPRDLRAERAARPRRQGAGRPVQHHAGRRRPDQRVSGAPSARRPALLHGEPRGLHGARQDHHAAQGPDRQRDHHALPRGRGARRRHHEAGGVDGARPEARADPAAARRARRAHRVRGAHGQAHRPPLGGLAAPADQRARERRVERRAAFAAVAASARSSRGWPTYTRRSPRSPGRSSSSTRASSSAGRRSRASSSGGRPTRRSSRTRRTRTPTRS